MRTTILAAAFALTAFGAAPAAAQGSDKWRPTLHASELEGTPFAAELERWAANYWSSATGGLNMEFVEVGAKAARAWPQVAAGNFSATEDTVLLKVLALTDSTLGVIPAEVCAAMDSPHDGGFTRMLAALDAPLARRWVAMLDEALLGTVAPISLTPMSERRTFTRDFTRGIMSLSEEDRAFLRSGESAVSTAAGRCRVVRLTMRALAGVPEASRVATIRTAFAPVRHSEAEAFRIIEGTDPVTGTPMVRATVYTPYHGVTGLRWECTDGKVTLSIHTGVPFERRPSPSRDRVGVDARFGEREFTSAWTLDRQARTAKAQAGPARRITAAAREADRVTIVVSDGRVRDPLDYDEARKLEFNLDGAEEALGRVLACGTIE